MRDDDLYLEHILEAIERILEYTSAGREAFEADLKTQDAVIRNLQVIGEAAKRVSDETRGRGPAVPWRNMTGLRDRVVHDYFGVRSSHGHAHRQPEALPGRPVVSDLRGAARARRDLMVISDALGYPDLFEALQAAEGVRARPVNATVWHWGCCDVWDTDPRTATSSSRSCRGVGWSVRSARFEGE